MYGELTLNINDLNELLADALGVDSIYIESARIIPANPGGLNQKVEIGSKNSIELKISVGDQ